MPRTKLRTPALREHVVAVAASTLASEGIAEFTAKRVAAEAATSVPAIYELFGDKTGLLREVFFDAFRRLHEWFDRCEQTDDPRADLVAVFAAFRAFVAANPTLAQLMFSHPFAAFDPRPDEAVAGANVREFVIAHVRRCSRAGLLKGNTTDIAHTLLALAQGLAVQETAGWLGTTQTDRNRRWRVAFNACLDGFSEKR